MAKEQDERDSSWLNDYGITNPKQRRFLTAFSVHGNLRRSETDSGVSRVSHQRWMNETGPEGEKYRAAHADAKVRSCEYLEGVAWDRATEGIKVQKWHNGKVVGHDVVKSDLLLIFMMKGAMPNKYRDLIDPTKRDGAITLEDLVASANKLLTQEKEKAAAAEAQKAAEA